VTTHALSGGPRMRRRRIAASLATAAALITIAILNGPAANAQRYVPATDPKLPKLKYADSLTSVNDRCVVTHNKLNPQIDPIYINGVPVGFC
jgi:hypothetical protein